MFPLKSDLLLKWTLTSSCLLVGIITISIFVFVGIESLPHLTAKPLGFIFDPSWDPTGNKFNLTPMIAGSLAISLGAILLAAPLGFFSAIFYEFLGPTWIAKPYRAIIEILAGIPSVIYGFWGLTAIVPILYQLSPPGASILAGSIVLGIMILPTVSLFISNGMRGLPRELYLSSQALGLSRSTIVFKVLIPTLRGPIFSGLFIAMGRALGETMAVLMVCGNIVKIPQSIFDPARTLTSNIALEMAYALDHHRSALFLSGLLLLLIVAGMSLASQSKIFRAAYDS